MDANSEKRDSAETDGNLLQSLTEGKQIEMLKAEKEKLKKSLDEKNENLRKLKLVKMYREKNNLQDIEELTVKWRTAAQEAVQELYNSVTLETKPSIGEFIKSLHIDEKMIQFNAEDDCFY